MSRGLNKVMLIGHLGRDPEMRYTPSGRPVTTFTIATTRTWNTSNGERHTETEWFNVVTWGNLAEICKQYLSKGQQVYVEGRLQTRRWEDSEGNKHTSVEIVANEMMILGERREPLSNNHFTESLQETHSTDEEIEEDEYPF
ncbi:single-stranded DNA-binding protein [Thermanaerothrix daxensis]|uniref:Single-stranded DNA-binding protein n=1 Tax=Thermanaerothrix daxensis TaxID=869279 RepID=A0A0P6XSC0_9CHLR|nr:single-stranded DNA-binding protein [Thermanaerothrix daxensis]